MDLRAVYVLKMGSVMGAIPESVLTKTGVKIENVQFQKKSSTVLSVMKIAEKDC